MPLPGSLLRSSSARFTLRSHMKSVTGTYSSTCLAVRGHNQGQPLDLGRHYGHPYIRLPTTKMMATGTFLPTCSSMLG